MNRKLLLKALRLTTDKYWQGYLDGKLDSYNTDIPDDLAWHVFINYHKNEDEKNNNIRTKKRLF